MKVMNLNECRKIILRISNVGHKRLEEIKPEYVAILNNIQKRYGEEKLTKLLETLSDISSLNNRQIN